MDSMSESEKQAAQTILATGSLNSEAAQQLMITNPQAAKALLQASRDIKQSGTMTREGAFAIDDAFNKGAIASQKNAAQVTLATYDAEKWGKGIVSNLDRANRAEQANGSLRATAAQQEADRQKQLTEGAKGLDPAAMKKNMEGLADLSNKFMAALANSPLLDKMLKSFAGAIDELTPILIGGLTWVADHAKELAIGMGILGGLMVISNAIITAANLVQAVNVLGLTALASAVWATVAPILAAAAPFIAVAAAVAGVVYLFKKLYDSGWTFGTIIDALKDNFQRLWMTLQDWMDSLLEKIPNAIGGISKAEADRRRALRDDQRKELDAKEKDRDDKRKQTALERGIKEEDKKATQENTKTTQAATAAKAEEAKTTEAQVEAQKKINYTSPEETFKAFKERKTMGGGASASASSSATTSPAAPSGGPAPGAAGPLNQDQQKNMAMVEEALKKQGITDPAYIAAVKGNIMKETGGKSISENMNYANTSNDRIRKIFGSRAAGKSDAELNAIKGDQQKMGEMMYGSGTAMGRQMGNSEPGDGWKYRGRGFIQLTGKNNYAAASKAIYGDDRLVKNPDLVNDPQVAAEVSAWYMKKGQAGMAGKLGMGTSGLSQEQANLLATSQIAGGDIRKKGAIGEEILGKVNSYSGQFAKGGTATPSAATAQTSVSQQPAATATSTTPAQNKAGATTPTPSKTNQETAESQLSLLNTKMDLLVLINRKLLEVNDKQLTTQKSMTGNVYTS
jgi:predicted chitinase